MPIILTPQQRATALYQAVVVCGKDYLELEDTAITRAQIAELAVLLPRLEALLDIVLDFADGGGTDDWPT